MSVIEKIKAAVVGAPKRRPRPEISTLAARVLGRAKARETETVEPYRYNALLADAKRLAASALSQDEVAGNG